MKLTNKQQIDVLESVLEDLVSGNAEWSGLCIFLLYELSKRGHIYYREMPFDRIRLFIPLFTIENAVAFGADINNGLSYWWPLPGISSRVKFLKWMIEQLKLNSDETTND